MRGARWGVEHIPDQRGRTVLVTGATSGLGRETSRRLFERGAHVILTGRSEERGASLCAELLATGGPGTSEFRRLDLLDLDDIRRFADRLLVETHRIDVLVNNAGIGNTPFRLSPQGHESQFATNHLGHFLLTGLLFPALANGADPRVVTVTSPLYRTGKLDLADLDGARGYSPSRAYLRAKLANVLFGTELDRRLRAAGSPVRSLLVHPGSARTSINQAPRSRWEGLIATLMSATIGRSVEEGALTSLFAATSPGIRGGSLIGPRRLLGPMRPGEVPLRPPADDTALAGRLWTISEELTVVAFRVAR